ncbi:MAG: C25 family cysteine peptidase [Pirellulales bacterium]
MSTFLVWAWLCAVPAAPTPAAADTAVVCPASFLPALQPWLLYRERQGHQLALVPSEQSAEQIRDEIRAVARAGQLRAIVLVGDADPAAAQDAAVRARCTPTHRVAARVNIQWGSEPEIATDNWYADLDDDDLPDVAIGRLPVDSPRELTALVQRIIEYEQSRDFGAWRQRVNFVAGVGGFGALVDTILESATRKFLTDGIPQAYATTMTYGSWRSPYCPDPRRFQQATLERFNEGCLFWVYIGHGHPLQLDRVRLPNGTHPILTIHDVGLLNSRRTPPIAVMLACYTGAYDLSRDCLAEEMLRTPGGPIAVLAGTRVTMPYAMALLSHGMLEEVFREHRETVGEVLLHAKRRMMRDEPEDGHRQLIDALAAAVSPAANQLPEERREHLHLFNLLGDPLLRLQHPADAKIEIPTDVDAGDTIEIVLDSPVAGTGTVELVCRRDRLRNDPPARGDFAVVSRDFGELDDTYRRANDRRWLQETLTWDEPGAIRARLEIPPEAHGPCHLTLHVHGQQCHALGAANVFIRRQRKIAP